jgi:hypothetical protein
LTVEWNDKKVLRAVDREVDRVERRGAALVAATAKVLVPKDERNWWVRSSLKNQSTATVAIWFMHNRRALQAMSSTRLM